MMSKEKYLSLFSCQMGSLKIGKYHLDVPQFYLGHTQSCDMLRPIALVRKYFMNNVTMDIWSMFRLIQIFNYIKYT